MVKRIGVWTVLIFLSLGGRAIFAQTQIAADFDQNGAVDYVDFARFMAAFGTRVGTAGFQPVFDLNNDGAVDGEDAFLFADVFSDDAPQAGLTLSSGGNGQAQLRLDPTDNGFLVYLDNVVRMGGYRIVLSVPDTVRVLKVEDYLNIGLLPVRKTPSGVEIVGLVLGNQAIEQGGLIAAITFSGDTLSVRDTTGVSVSSVHLRGNRVSLGNHQYLGDRNTLSSGNLTRTPIGDFELRPRILDLGEVAPGQIITRTVSIKNTFNAQLVPGSSRRLSFEITSADVQLVAEPKIYGVLADTSAGLTSGATQTIKVSFTPTKTGIFSDVLTIKTNRSERQTVQIHVKAKVGVSGKAVRAFADFDSSGSVDYTDLSKLIARFGSLPDSSQFDLDKDGVVDGDDAFLLADVLGNFTGRAFSDTVRIVEGINPGSAVRVQESGEELTLFVRELARLGGYRIVLKYDPEAVDLRWARDLSGAGVMPIHKTSTGAEIVGVGFGARLQTPGDLSLARVSVRPLKGQANAASLVSVSGVVFRGLAGERDSVGVVRIGANGLDASPRVVDFGRMRLGATAQKTLRIYNLNTASTSFQIVSSDTLVATSPKSIGNLGAGRTWDVAVTYRSVRPGPFESKLTLSAIGEDVSPITIVVKSFGAVVSASVDSLAFGDVFVGQHKIQTVTLSNPDLTPFVIDAVGFSGANAHFELNPSPVLPVSVGPEGGTATFAVQFKPQIRDVLRDTLKISGAGKTFVIPVSGRGLVHSAGVSAAQLDFGRVNLGRDTTAMVILNNTGNVPYVVDSLKIARRDTSFFVLKVPQFPDTLAVGRRDSVVVRFAPDTTGVKADTLRIFSADTTWILPLSGTGLPRPIVVPPPVENVLVVTFGGTIEKTRNLLHFGHVPWNRSDSLKVRVQNRRGANMTFRFSATDPQVKVRPDSVQNLPPNQEWDVLLTLTPKDSIQTVSAFRITTDDPGDGVTVIPVKSGGSHPVLSASQIDFGRVALGYAPTQTFTLTNAGHANLILEAVTHNTDSAFVLISPPTLPLSVAAEGGQHTFQVRFGPKVRGTFADTLRFAAFDTAFVLPLRGAGRESKITATPPVLSFGLVRLGLADTASVTLANVGGDTVFVDSLNFKGTGLPFAFVKSPVLPDTLAPMSNRVHTIRFAPTVAALARDTLRARIGLDTLSVPISGTGAVARATLSDAALPFGTIPVGRFTLDTLLVNNVGNVPFVIQSATLRFGNRGFSIDSRSPSDTIAVNGVYRLTLRFVPDSTRTQVDTLKVVGTDTVFTLVVTATGSPSMTVTRTQGGLTALPAYLDFGDLATGGAGKRIVRLVNNGTTPYTVSLFSHDPALVVSPAALTDLPVGQEWPLVVTWTPSQNSPLLTVLRIAGSDSLRVRVGRKGIFATLLTDSLVYGDIRLGTTLTKTVRVRNQGQGAFVIDHMAIKGGAGFVLPTVPTLPVLLKEGDSLNVQVRFEPAVIGAVKDTLRLTGVDTAFAVPLSGRGVQPIVEVSPQALNFGDVTTGADSTRKLTIQNLGNADIVLDSVRVISSGTVFVITARSFYPNTLKANGKDSVTVAFTPPDLGTYSGVLEFFGEKKVWAVPLSGISTTTRERPSNITVAFGPTVTRNDSTLNFGDIPTGATRKLQFTVRNDRDSILSVLAKTTDAQLGVLPASVSGLLPGQSATFVVSFTPVEDGAIASVLTLTSNAAADGTVRLLVQKNRPPVRVQPAQLDFGPLVMGRRDTQFAVVTNPQLLNFRITALRFARNDGFGLAQVLSLPDTVKANGGMRTLPVVFAPARRGVFADTLSIVGADTTLRVVLKGTGLLQQVGVVPDSLTFGSLPINADSMRSVLISNTGDISVAFGQVQLVGSPAFSLVDAPQTTDSLRVNGTRLLHVKFRPTVGGSQQATLQIGIGTQTLLVWLTGTGIVPPRTTPGPIALDLDTAIGNQNVRQKHVQGRNITIDLAATEGVVGKTGFEVVLTFDSTAVAYRGFDLTDLFTGATPTVTEAQGHVQIVVSLLTTAPRDSGSLGQVRFELLEQASATDIVLSSGKFTTATGPIPLEIGSDGAKVTVSGTTEPSADFDGDGLVGFSDFLLFAAHFGKSGTEFDARYDLDSNGAVGFGDFIIFASKFGSKIGKPVLAKPSAE